MATPWWWCLVTQLCPTLCSPMDCSLPGSSVHRIFQQEYWSELLFLTLGDLLNPGIKPVAPAAVSPAVADGFFTTSDIWKAQQALYSFSSYWLMTLKHPVSAHEPLSLCISLIISSSLIALSSFISLAQIFLLLPNWHVHVDIYQIAQHIAQS